MASRPASMRLAMAISPSRESSSTEPMSRRYMRTGSSVRSVGSARVCGDGGQARRGDRAAASAPPPRRPRASCARRLLGLLALDHGDAHVGQHRHGVLDLVGGHLLGGQHGIERVERDEAARLGGLDELLDRRIGQVEKRAVLLRSLGLARRSARQPSRSLPFHNSRARGCGAARGRKFQGSRALQDRCAEAQQPQRSRRAACRHAGSSRKAPVARARRPSRWLAWPSLRGLRRHTQLACALPVFLFCHQRGKHQIYSPLRLGFRRTRQPWAWAAALGERCPILGRTGILHLETIGQPLLQLGDAGPGLIAWVRPKLAFGRVECTFQTNLGLVQRKRMPPPALHARGVGVGFAQTCRFCG